MAPPPAPHEGPVSPRGPAALSLGSVALQEDREAQLAGRAGMGDRNLVTAWAHSAGAPPSLPSSQPGSLSAASLATRPEGAQGAVRHKCQLNQVRRTRPGGAGPGGHSQERERRGPFHSFLQALLASRVNQAPSPIRLPSTNSPSPRCSRGGRLKCQSLPDHLGSCLSFSLLTPWAPAQAPDISEGLPLVCTVGEVLSCPLSALPVWSPRGGKGVDTAQEVWPGLSDTWNAEQGA